MSTRIFKYSLYLFMFFISINGISQSSKPIPELQKKLSINQIAPKGWLKEKLRQNLNGFTGHLDELEPTLIQDDDIYGKDRLSKKVQHKNVGAMSDAVEFQSQFLWWNSETQSNWFDGYIRTAVLLHDSIHLKKISTKINYLLSTQDADGYLGIYDKELRYNFNDENGELWSKTTLCRALLAWYDYSKDNRVLNAVLRCADNVITNYPINASHPFATKNPYAGGLTHGLAFTDVLEQLYVITKDHKYLDYIPFLYNDFSKQNLNEDAQQFKLMKASVPLMGHSVHTYEHLRTVAAAYQATGDASLKLTLDGFLQKINQVTTASGAAIGDEFIGGRKADATNAGYEYCSLLELMDAYISLYKKTNDPNYANKIEKLFFNAALGASHPTESSICYLKTDNSYALEGGKNGDQSDKNQTRYRYSPVHKEAAVCCVPNAGKIVASYVENMWFQNGNNVLALLLGPSELKFNLKGNPITIKEITSYPYSNKISFKITNKKSERFSLIIKKPEGVEKLILNMPYEEKGGYIQVNRIWKNDDELIVQMDMIVQSHHTAQGEQYFMYGPLVLAHPIDAKQQITKNYSVAGLKEMTYTAFDKSIYLYTGMPVTKMESLNDIRFSTTMKESTTGKIVPLELIPMGKTILRQTTFKKAD
ncbi:MAG: glycoside hydrolase family 127 protein [Bacteroidetes bacterium]|nr:glycoside hydrolase family 127 protein [Bacteroidota bacterium]